MGGALSPFAAKLADAIARRHALDQIADAGDSVPAQVAHHAETDIRNAELALVRAGEEAAR